MPPTAHAILGASSSKRWMMCPGSVRLSEGMPNESSEYAKEGTAAHNLAEQCLRDKSDARDHLGEEIKADGSVFEVDEDMADAVQEYLDFIRDTLAEPKDGNLVVVDYKHGRGVAVEAEHNTQGMYYGLGALLGLKDRVSKKPKLLIEHKFNLEAIYPGLFGTNDACILQGHIHTVEIVIVQPRCPHPDGSIRRWSISVADLVDWSVDLVAAVKATEIEGAPLASGEHCKFCPAAPVCPKLEEDVLAACMADFGSNSGDLIVPEPKTLDSETLGKVLTHAKLIEDWVRRVTEYAHHEAEAGRMPTGYKLVAKRASRYWKDADTAEAYLKTELKLKPDEVNTYKLKSPAQIEKVLGKARKGEVADLIESISSGAVLAREDDPRAAVKSEAQSDFTKVGVI